MRQLAAAVSLAVLVPVLALAEPQGATPPDWSIGGGVSWTVVGNPSAGFLLPSGAYMMSLDTSLPFASASIERRAGERTLARAPDGVLASGSPQPTVAPKIRPTA